MLTFHFPVQPNHFADDEFTHTQHMAERSEHALAVMLLANLDQAAGFQRALELAHAELLDAEVGPGGSAWEAGKLHYGAARKEQMRPPAGELHPHVLTVGVIPGRAEGEQQPAAGLE